jgi:hypothetical protein
LCKVKYKKIFKNKFKLNGLIDSKCYYNGWIKKYLNKLIELVFIFKICKFVDLKSAINTKTTENLKI